MLWMHVYFERDLDLKDIVKALAHVFEVEEPAIVLAYGEREWGNVNDDDPIALYCSYNIVRGDFPINLGIGFWTGWKREFPKDAERYAILGDLCDLLDCSALVTGDYPGPYIWTLVQSKNDYQYVSLVDNDIDQPDDAIELEIDDYLYKFRQPLSDLERRLGTLITRKDFEIEETGYRTLFMNWVSKSSKEVLLQTLNNIRPEAKRMYREDLLQEIIDSIEQS